MGRNRGKGLMTAPFCFGMAAALQPFGRLLCRRNVLVRGSVYMMLIFATEYATGWFPSILLPEGWPAALFCL